MYQIPRPRDTIALRAEIILGSRSASEKSFKIISKSNRIALRAEIKGVCLRAYTKQYKLRIYLIFLKYIREI